MILFYEFLTLWFLFIYILDIGLNVTIINTYVLSMIISFFGLYITYYIKELQIDNLQIKGHELIIIDIIFHQLPFVYMLINHNKFKNRYDVNSTFLTILFTCIYYIFIDIYKVYKFDKKKTRYMFLLTIISVILFTTLLH
uniref:Uncharacterized protein n=1 Tax=viral metagenome TaxID=1070528 RepID=A0A6C0BNP2_9ZZZZ